MNTLLRRLTSTARRRVAVTRAAIRRRPRTFAAAGLLVAVVALIGGGGLALVSMAPPATTATTNTAPVFTIRAGWTLADLERHIEAGDVDAITAAPVNAGNPAGQLLARTRTGQVVSIDLAIGPSDAVAALTSLGYGNLLTTEAIGIAPGATVPSPSGGAFAILFPLLLLAFVIAVVMRMSRRNDDDGSPFLEVAGVEGSTLRVSRHGLTVLRCPDAMSDISRDGRFWAYGLIRDVRLDDYGPLGVVRTKVRSTGGDVPLLLLEPHQVSAARRALEMVWNLMSAGTDRRIDA
jgi:hypothetical protein